MTGKLCYEEASNRIFYKSYGKWKLSGEYKGITKVHFFECTKCNFKINVKYYYMQRTCAGRLCPSCFPPIYGVRQRVSHGEISIQRYLDKRGLSYIQEYSFDESSGIQNLRFDFAIVDNKGEVLKLVEYDGEQHFRACDFFGGEEALKKIKNSDKSKNRYCKENNIPLKRIKYTQHGKIFEILEEYTKDIESDISSGTLVKSKVFGDSFKYHFTKKERDNKRYEPIKQANDMKKSERDSKVIELRERGMKLKEIAESMGVSLSTVCRIVKRKEG